MANAVFQRELKLGLRSQRAFLAQVVFVTCLALVVLLAWPKGERVGIQAELSRSLFLTLAASMFALVTLLSPVFVAASLTSEKEAGTLEMLIVSPIPPGEIASGKQLASILYLLLLVVTGLPVLGLCYFLGGVGGPEVLGLSMQLLGYTCLLGAIGLFASHVCGRTHGALVVTYLVAIPLGCGVVLLVLSNPGFLNPWSAGYVVFLEGVVFAILYAWVVAGLAKPPSTASRPAEEERPEEQAVLQLQRSYFPDSLLWPQRPEGYLPDGTNPVYMKEVTCEIFGRGTGLVRTILVGTLILSMCASFALSNRHPEIYFGFLNLCMMLIAPAFAANAFTQERERGTYDLLRTTLLTPDQLLKGKFLAIVRFMLVLLSFMLVPVVVAIIPMGSEHPMNNKAAEFSFSLVMNLVIVLGTLLVSTATGLLMSLVFRRSAGAMIGAYAAVFLFGIVPVAVFAVLRQFTTIPPTELARWGATSPFLGSLTLWWEGRQELFGRTQDFPLVWLHYLGLSLLATVGALAHAWYRLGGDERRS